MDWVFALFRARAMMVRVRFGLKKKNQKEYKVYYIIYIPEVYYKLTNLLINHECK